MIMYKYFHTSTNFITLFCICTCFVGFCVCVVYIVIVHEIVYKILRYLVKLPFTLRWLAANDPLRQGYGPEVPPPARTHTQACAEAKAAEAAPYHSRDTKSNIRFQTGIKHWCPLSVLNLFDMIWDFCPDLMHIIKTFFERLVLGVFSGSRHPSAFSQQEPEKPGRSATAAVRAKYQKQRGKYEKNQTEYEQALLAFAECKFNMVDQTIVDERVQNLVGHPYWIRSSMVYAHFHANNPRIMSYLETLLGYSQVCTICTTNRRIFT